MARLGGRRRLDLAKRRERDAHDPAELLDVGVDETRVEARAQAGHVRVQALGGELGRLRELDEEGVGSLSCYHSNMNVRYKTPCLLVNHQLIIFLHGLSLVNTFHILSDLIM